MGFRFFGWFVELVWETVFGCLELDPFLFDVDHLVGEELPYF